MYVAGERVHVLMEKRWYLTRCFTCGPKSWCVVLCTVCKFVSDWHGHVRGWEGSIARRSRGFGSPRYCSGMSFPSLWRECI